MELEEVGSKCSRGGREAIALEHVLAIRRSYQMLQGLCQWYSKNTMVPKRRRSSASDNASSKRLRICDPEDYISQLSDELLIRILHHLPLPTILQTHLLSHRFYTLSTDSQLWKSLYYSRFVLPRALRIPGIKSAQPEHALHFSSRRSKWLDEGTLVEGGEKTNWKRQYKLRHNWSIGACEVQEIRVQERPSTPTMLLKLAEGVVITVDKEDGLRAWELKSRTLIAKMAIKDALTPTCLAIDESEAGHGQLGIAVGFVDGAWGTWILHLSTRVFSEEYIHPASSNGTLRAIAYSKPYILTITESQLLSLYSFAPIPLKREEASPEAGKVMGQEFRNMRETLPASSMLLEDLEAHISSPKPRIPQDAELARPKLQPHLLASLKSHTSWPPLSLSIRTTSSSIIASIAYSLPTYLSGYTIGLQELHLDPSTAAITSSRLTSALPPFASLSTSPNASPPSSTSSSRPTTLSYNHPYILATHPDNTLTLYLCTSTREELKLTSGTKLWGHTSSVASAEITSRGKAVSVCGRGEELRVWELEGGLSSSLKEARRKSRVSDRSVVIRPEKGSTVNRVPENREVKDDWQMAKRHWVGFDDEVVIVLKESEGAGAMGLMVYDFT